MIDYSEKIEYELQDIRKSIEMKFGIGDQPI